MKYFIVCGSYDQFRTFTNKKYEELMDSGHPIQRTDFIFANAENIRGYRNPRGWFYGTWRDRTDIDELITGLRILHSNQNIVLETLHWELRENSKMR